MVLSALLSARCNRLWCMRFPRVSFNKRRSLARSVNIKVLAYQHQSPILLFASIIRPIIRVHTYAAQAAVLCRSHAEGWLRDMVSRLKTNLRLVGLSNLRACGNDVSMELSSVDRCQSYYFCFWTDFVERRSIVYTSDCELTRAQIDCMHADSCWCTWLSVVSFIFIFHFILFFSVICVLRIRISY